MSETETRTTQLTVLPKGDRVFSEMATTVTLDDEAGGEFVEVQSTADGLGKIQINPSEWPPLRDAIDRMIAECREYGQ